MTTGGRGERGGGYGATDPGLMEVPVYVGRCLARRGCVLAQIKNAAHSEGELQELLESFRHTAQLALLFVRNVSRVEVYVMEDEGPPRVVATITPPSGPGPTPDTGDAAPKSDAGGWVAVDMPASSSCCTCCTRQCCDCAMCAPRQQVLKRQRAQVRTWSRGLP